MMTKETRQRLGLLTTQLSKVEGIASGTRQVVVDHSVDLSRLEQRVEALERKATSDRLDRFKSRLFVSGAIGASKLRSDFGARIAYRPRTVLHWEGIVIPRPPNAPRFGRTGEEFIYVLRLHDYAVRGCYPSRLVRL